MRRGADLAVFLYAFGVPVAVARTIDVSLRGLQITCEPALEGLELGTRIEVGLEFEDGAITRRVRAPARVAHTQWSRVGLAFAILDPELGSTVRAVIRSTVERRMLEDGASRVESTPWRGVDLGAFDAPAPSRTDSP